MRPRVSTRLQLTRVRSCIASRWLGARRRGGWPRRHHVGVHGLCLCYVLERTKKSPVHKSGQILEYVSWAIHCEPQKKRCVLLRDARVYAVDGSGEVVENNGHKGHQRVVKKCGLGLIDEVRAGADTL